jgi:hypothetical protein
MKDFLDGIIKLLQIVALSATALEILMRVIRDWLTH